MRGESGVTLRTHPFLIDCSIARLLPVVDVISTYSYTMINYVMLVSRQGKSLLIEPSKI
jgi:hypothetical protein